MRVVLTEGALDEFGVPDHVGVERDLNHLGVVAQRVVRRVGLRAAGVAGSGPDDAVERAEARVGAPEAAEPERRRLGVLRLGGSLVVLAYRAWCECHRSQSPVAPPYRSR